MSLCRASNWLHTFVGIGGNGQLALHSHKLVFMLPPIENEEKIRAEERKALGITWNQQHKVTLLGRIRLKAWPAEETNSCACPMDAPHAERAQRLPRALSGGLCQASLEEWCATHRCPECQHW